MSEVLDEAVKALRQMPPSDRDSVAQAILTLAQGGAPLEIESDHLPFVLEGLAQLERGEFVEGEAAELVAAAFDRHRR